MFLEEFEAIGHIKSRDLLPSSSSKYSHSKSAYLSRSNCIRICCRLYTDRGRGRGRCSGRCSVGGRDRDSVMSRGRVRCRYRRRNISSSICLLCWSI